MAVSFQFKGINSQVTEVKNNGNYPSLSGVFQIYQVWLTLHTYWFRLKLRYNYGAHLPGSFTGLRIVRLLLGL